MPIKRAKSKKNILKEIDDDIVTAFRNAFKNLKLTPFKSSKYIKKSLRREIESIERDMRICFSKIPKKIRQNCHYGYWEKHIVFLDKETIGRAIKIRNQWDNGLEKLMVERHENDCYFKKC